MKHKLSETQQDMKDEILRRFDGPLDVLKGSLDRTVVISLEGFPIEVVKKEDGYVAFYRTEDIFEYLSTELEDSVTEAIDSLFDAYFKENKEYQKMLQEEFGKVEQIYTSFQ